MNTVENALIFATKAHSGQYRKETSIPFMVHILEVGNIIREMTQKDGSVNQIAMAAGFLHDTVEDAGITFSELKEKFGEEVTHLVEIQTEDKSKSWKERKDHMMEFLESNEDEVSEICILADKLSNVRSLHMEYKEVGEKLWDKFNAPKEKQFWYYNTISTLMKKVRSTPQFKEYESLLEDLFPQEV